MLNLYLIGLSLYHALLKQCAGLARVNIDSQVPTRLVKQQFRKLKDLDSPTRILNALKAGREVHFHFFIYPSQIGQTRKSPLT